MACIFLWVFFFLSVCFHNLPLSKAVRDSVRDSVCSILIAKEAGDNTLGGSAGICAASLGGVIVVAVVGGVFIAADEDEPPAAAVAQLLLLLLLFSIALADVGVESGATPLPMIWRPGRRFASGCSAEGRRHSGLSPLRSTAAMASVP